MAKWNRLTYTLFFMLFLALCMQTTNNVQSNEVGVEHFVQGVNEAREHIKSGELRLIMIEEFAARDAEWINQWMEAQLHRRKDRIEGKNPEELKQRLEIESTMFKDHEKRHEISIAFEVDDINPFRNPKNYRYKQLVTDRTVWNVDDPFGVFINLQTMSYFNDGIQLLEDDLPNAIEVSIFTADRLFPTFLNYHLWGRSPYRIAAENVKSQKTEEIGGRKYLVRTISIDDKTYTFWMDKKNELIFKREQHSSIGDAALVTQYQDYREFPGGIWYPTLITERVRGSSNQRVEATTYHVKDAVFNVEFPPDYFVIDLEKVYESGVAVNPVSDIKMERDVDAQKENDILCAPKSLLYLCNLFGVEATLDELSELCKVDPTSGTTLLNLHKAAEKKGLSPKAVKMEWQDFQKIQFPAIVHLNYDHYFVVNGIKDGKVMITDSPSSYNLSMDEFRQIWNGYTLLVNNPKHSKADRSREKRNKISYPKHPRIKFAQLTFEFGTALGGEQINHNFEFTNEGSDSLKIKHVDTSCRCTAAKLETTEFSPGQKGYIQVALDVPSKSRAVEETAVVFTNDPESPKIELTLKGESFVPIAAAPNHIILGRKRLLQASTLNLALNVPDSEHTQIEELEPSSPYLTARSETTDGMTHRVDLMIAKETPIGSFKEHLKINYIHKGKNGFIDVPISGEILGDIVLSVRKLFFGMVNSRVAKQITLSGVGSLPFEVISVETDSPNLSVQILNHKENRYVLEAVLSADAISKREFHGAITVKTTSEKQPEINIPVYAIIKKQT